MRKRHARKKTRKSETLPTLGDVIDVLRNDVRRNLLITLESEEKDVTTLSEELDTHISVVSHNLRALREMNVVDVERDSRRRIYRLGPAVKIARRGGQISMSMETDDGQQVTIKSPAA